MWSELVVPWSLSIVRPWRLGFSAVLALLRRRGDAPHITVSAMSDEWLREYEARTRYSDEQ